MTYDSKALIFSRFVPDVHRCTSIQLGRGNTALVVGKKDLLFFPAYLFSEAPKGFLFVVAKDFNGSTNVGVLQRLPEKQFLTGSYCRCIPSM